MPCRPIRMCCGVTVRSKLSATLPSRSITILAPRADSRDVVPKVSDRNLMPTSRANHREAIAPMRAKRGSREASARGTGNAPGRPEIAIDRATAEQLGESTCVPRAGRTDRRRTVGRPARCAPCHETPRRRHSTLLLRATRGVRGAGHKPTSRTRSRAQPWTWREMSYQRKETAKSRWSPAIGWPPRTIVSSSSSGRHCDFPRHVPALHYW